MLTLRKKQNPGREGVTLLPQVRKYRKVYSLYNIKKYINKIIYNQVVELDGTNSKKIVTNTQNINLKHGEMQESFAQIMVVTLLPYPTKKQMIFFRRLLNPDHILEESEIFGILHQNGPGQMEPFSISPSGHPINLLEKEDNMCQN